MKTRRTRQRLSNEAMADDDYKNESTHDSESSHDEEENDEDDDSDFADVYPSTMPKSELLKLEYDVCLLNHAIEQSYGGAGNLKKLNLKKNKGSKLRAIVKNFHLQWVSKLKKRKEFPRLTSQERSGYDLIRRLYRVVHANYSSDLNVTWHGRAKTLVDQRHMLISEILTFEGWAEIKSSFYEYIGPSTSGHKRNIRFDSIGNVKYEKQTMSTDITAEKKDYSTRDRANEGHPIQNSSLDNIPSKETPHQIHLDSVKLTSPSTKKEQYVLDYIVIDTNKNDNEPSLYHVSESTDGKIENKISPNEDGISRGSTYTENQDAKQESHVPNHESANDKEINEKSTNATPIRNTVERNTETRNMDGTIHEKEDDDNCPDARIEKGTRSTSRSPRADGSDREERAVDCEDGPVDAKDKSMELNNESNKKRKRDEGMNNTDGDEHKSPGRRIWNKKKRSYSMNDVAQDAVQDDKDECKTETVKERMEIELEQRRLEIGKEIKLKKLENDAREAEHRFELEKEKLGLKKKSQEQTDKYLDLLLKFGRSLENGENETV